MPKPTLYKAYDQKGFTVYALEPLGGRPPADFQLYALVNGALFFDWNCRFKKDEPSRDLSFNIGEEPLDRLGEKMKAGNTAYILGFRGWIPDGVVAQGNKAILAHVAGRIARRRARLKSIHDAVVKNICVTNVCLDIEHQGTQLSGRIVDLPGKRGGIEIRLESPKAYADSDTIEMSYGRARGHGQIYTRHGKLSQSIIDEAQELLIKMFERRCKEERLSSMFKFA